MKRVGAALAGLTIGVFGTSAPAATPAPLERALNHALVARGIDPGRTGALALDLRTGAVAYSKNADVPLLPASAEKLPVSFTALRLLGPAFRFRTTVVGTGEQAGSVWKGNLVLVGYGDPTLAESDLDALAKQVRAWGIRSVEGRVFGDESFFDARRDAPGWKPSYLGIESRPLSALSVEGVKLRGADASAAAAARAFARSLHELGILVHGTPGKGRAPTDAYPLAEDVSDPLAAIVRHMNRESDNFVAEMLLKELGASVARRGTTAAGAVVVRQELEQSAVPLGGVRISDGSGLSRSDRLTSAALVAILLAGSTDPAIRDSFVESLSVAGISGTLERRLDRRPTRGQIIAKTGTTNAASALAGFVRRRYVFAILQNGSPVPYWTARAAQDRFVTVLARR